MEEMTLGPNALTGAMKPTGCQCVYCTGTRDDLAEYAAELELQVAELERWKPLWRITLDRVRRLAVEKPTWKA